MIKKLILIKLIIYAVIIAALLLFLNTSNIFAQEPKHIGIEWSDTCLTLIESGDLETCGNPELIKSAYPQAPLKATFQKMFDDMAKTDQAKYQKNSIYQNHLKSCIIKNYCNIFDSKLNVYYWYEIPDQARDYLDKIITINSSLKHMNLNVYNQEVFVYSDSRALILDTNQINIKRCYQITYTPGNSTNIQLREMGYIIWHILDDCKDLNKLGILNAPYTEKLDLTVIPISESPAYMELLRLEGLKAKYKENMIGKD